MLMDKNNKTIAYERAECARAVEYMRCMTEDAFMADRFVQIEMADKNFNESVDTKENREILKNLTVESDEDKDEEINRIIDATHDLSIDEMLGIQKSAGDYEMDAFTEGVNLDAKSVSRDLKKKCLPLIRKMKKAISKNQFDDAEKYRKEALKEFKKCKAQFKLLDFDNNSISQTVFGYLLWSVCESIKTILLVLVSLPIGGAAGVLYQWVEVVRVIINTINSIADSLKEDGHVTIGNFNVTKTKVESVFNDTERSIVNAEKIIKELKEMDKKED